MEKIKFIGVRSTTQLDNTIVICTISINEKPYDIELKFKSEILTELLKFITFDLLKDKLGNIIKK